MKNMNFPRAGELHRRAGRQAALQGGPVGCTLRWAAEKGGPEGCPFLQPAGSPFCTARWPVLLSSMQPASPPTVHVFHLETRSSSPPGPPALQLVLSIWFSFFVFQILQGKPLWLARSVDIPRAVYNFRFFATYILHHVEDSTQLQKPAQALNYVQCVPAGVCGLIRSVYAFILSVICTARNAFRTRPWFRLTRPWFSFVLLLRSIGHDNNLDQSNMSGVNWRN